jgi:hypothetical protein
MYMQVRFFLLILMFGRIFLVFPLNAQQVISDPYIKEMRWENDSRIYLKLLNDSLYILNSKDLPHVSVSGDLSKREESTYYPVHLSSEYVSSLNSKNEQKDNIQAGSNKTLWTEIHTVIGGGSIHFIHCLTYALEIGQLDIRAPLLIRPKSNWKPDPITQSYSQTHKWKYFLPLTQREAHKEYKIRQKNGELSDLLSVPPDFLKLFLQTSEMQYKRMIRLHEIRNSARIDLVKILLGSKYLGTAQISFIKTQVLKAVLQSSSLNLPSVLVFDGFNAAVAMSLDETGYKIRKIVFYNAASLDSGDKESREQGIRDWIEKINEQNRVNFQKILKQRMQ